MITVNKILDLVCLALTRLDLLTLNDNKYSSFHIHNLVPMAIVHCLKMLRHHSLIGN